MVKFSKKPVPAAKHPAVAKTRVRCQGEQAKYSLCWSGARGRPTHEDALLLLCPHTQPTVLVGNECSRMVKFSKKPVPAAKHPAGFKKTVRNTSRPMESHLVPYPGLSA